MQMSKFRHRQLLKKQRDERIREFNRAVRGLLARKKLLIYIYRHQILREI